VDYNCHRCRIRVHLSQNADTPSIPPARVVEPNTIAADCTSTIWRKLLIVLNVAALLRRCSRLPGSKIFWVDSICINQSEKNGKGHQVRHIEEICRNRSLLIWLGEPTKDSNKAISLIKAAQRHLADPSQDCTDNSIRFPCDVSGLSKAAQDFAKSSQGTSLWKAFHNLVRRPWFTRRWIV
jgi:hypothetical protein